MKLIRSRLIQRIPARSPVACLKNYGLLRAFAFCQAKVLRCLLKLEYFDFVCLHFHRVFFQFHFSCKISVEFMLGQVPLFKFRQCEDYSEQSKPHFEPLTFAWQRCVLQREYFDFVCLYFH